MEARIECGNPMSTKPVHRTMSGHSPLSEPLKVQKAETTFTPPENPATPPGVPVPYPNTGRTQLKPVSK